MKKSKEMISDEDLELLLNCKTSTIEDINAHVWLKIIQVGRQRMREKDEEGQLDFIVEFKEIGVPLDIISQISGFSEYKIRKLVKERKKL